MKSNKVELSLDRNGNIIVLNSNGATAEEIQAAKAAYFAKARAMAKERADAMKALDKEFS